MAAVPLIAPAALSQLLDAGSPLVVLDVRWRLGADDGRTEYAAAHIAGAIYVDLETELSGPPDEQAGRHPLPSPEAVEQAAARWGVRPDSPVVVYDDNSGMSAARAWWLLRWIGHRQVKVLDGGLAAWRAAGGQVIAGESASRPTPLLAPGRRRSMPTVEVDDLVAGRVDLLLDARSAERFRGDAEPVDRVAGHIPGAVSAPTTDNLGPDGCLLSPDALRSRFEQLGASTGRRVAVYCGSGITATHEILALESAGIGAALFAPSWSGWIADPERPIATGDD